MAAGHGDSSDVIAAKRLAHTLKGSGAIIGLRGITALSHHLEDILEHFEQAGYTVAGGNQLVRDPRHWKFRHTAGHFWRGDDLLALGETAFGHVHGVHYQNVETFEAYTRRLAGHRLPLLRAYALTDEEKFRREAILLLKTGRLEVAMGVGANYPDLVAKLATDRDREVSRAAIAVLERLNLPAAPPAIAGR